ncbi:MAG: hypothetical protein JKY08_01965 [Flavobacteriaceae bacterium]|nr:hypothetical protein [Flavobacteriaceae bacterium]
MKPIFTFAIFMILTTSISWGQTPITIVDNSTIVTNTTAAEGDYYIGEAPVYQIYIGLANGEYQPVYDKNLAQILTINNSANNLTIINISDPGTELIDDQDAATKNYVDNNLAGTIYSNDGTLAAVRNVEGAAYDLAEKNIATYSIKATNTSLNSSEKINISAATAINFNTTDIHNAISVRGNFIDSSGAIGIAGQVLRSDGTNTEWVTSSATPKTIILYSKKSTIAVIETNQDYEEWAGTSQNGRTIVSTIDFTITEESIVNINYNFRYFKISHQAAGMRRAYLTISDLTDPLFPVIIEDYILPTVTSPIYLPSGKTNFWIKGTNKANKNYIYNNTGNYRVELRISGDFKIGTGLNIPGPNKYNFTGYTFDVCVTPKSF